MGNTLRRLISFCAGLTLPRPVRYAAQHDVKKIYFYFFPACFILFIFLEEGKQNAQQEPEHIGAQLPAAADTLPPLDTVRFPFIGWSKNQIARPEALKPFYQRLDLLKAGRIRQVRVVHIGDSHIQADLFSGRLRTLLQQRFGAAGRGMVFPYALARTNGPIDLRFSSPYSWETRRSIYDSEGPPLGICGISLRPAVVGATLSLTMNSRHQEGMDYSFDRVTVFHQSGDQAGFALLDPAAQPVAAASGATVSASQPVYHKVKSGETLSALSRRYGCSVAQLQRWNRLKSSRINIGQRLIVSYRGGAPAPVAADNTPTLAPDSMLEFGARFALPAPIQQLTLRVTGKNVSQSALFGLMLENSQRSGVLFHQIGVNGVTYNHYNQAEYFWKQFPALQADLVIVSLGTNEALSLRLSPQEFRQQVDEFIGQLRSRAPGAVVVLTTNPDVLRRRRYDNPGNLNVRQVILDAAADHGLASWDLYAIMGGRGSVRRWQANGLAGRDYVHFTKEGYWLQGQLLFQAMMSAYDNGN